MSLNSYKLDRAFTTGVEIRLDRAPDDVFMVRLPSAYNRGYSQAVYAAMDIDMEGNAGKTNFMVAKYARDEAFVEYCLLSLNGEDLPSDFLDEYPEAVDELVRKAESMANEIEEKVRDTVKKSQPTSTGKGSGQEKKTSIERSVGVAS